MVSKLTSQSSSLIFEISVITEVRNKKQYSDMITGNTPDCYYVLVKVFHFLDLSYFCQNMMSKVKYPTCPKHLLSTSIYSISILSPKISGVISILFKITDDLVIMPFFPLVRKRWEVTSYLRSYFRN